MEAAGSIRGGIQIAETSLQALSPLSNPYSPPPERACSQATKKQEIVQNGVCKDIPGVARCSLKISANELLGFDYAKVVVNCRHRKNVACL